MKWGGGSRAAQGRGVRPFLYLEATSSALMRVFDDLRLEREDSDYEPDFVKEYRQKVVIPKIEQFQSEQKLAESFNAYSDVPQELEKDGWAFMGLIEVTNLHYRELLDGLREGKALVDTERKEPPF